MANNELSLSSLGIQLPYNMQAEQSVLGAALMDETILNRLITEMDPDMFYSEQNRAVYEEMRRLFSESEAVDVITLVDSLAQNGVFKGADDAKVYITRIAETVPAISNVDSYIKIVKEKYQTRREALTIAPLPFASKQPAISCSSPARNPILTCCWKAPSKSCTISATARIAPALKPFRSLSWKLLIPCKSCPVRTAINLPVSPQASTIWIIS